MYVCGGICMYYICMNGMHVMGNMYAWYACNGHGMHGMHMYVLHMYACIDGL